MTQREVGQAAGLSQGIVSRAERGIVSGLQIKTIERIAAALGAAVFLDIRYQGGMADRLVDRAHAALVEYVVGFLRADWEVMVEYSFNHFGERGSVDVLAWHAQTRTLLIIEVKSRFTDLQAMLLSFGRKFRLVPDLLRRERGWDAQAVGRLLVVSGTTANRALVRDHSAMFDASFPGRAVAIKSWLRSPSGPIAGVWFVSGTASPTARTVGRQRRLDRDRRRRGNQRDHARP